MKSRLLFFITWISVGASAQLSNSAPLTNQEQSAVIKAFESDSVFSNRAKSVSHAIELYKQYKINVLKSDSDWESDQQRLRKIENIGYTTKFELIPLIEQISGNAVFKKADGVSYLIRTDSLTILFDTGIDEDTLKSYFRYNLDLLGIDISKIDLVFISHNHDDHQNDWKWLHDKTFVNSKNERILPKKIYVPESNLNLPVGTIFSSDPVRISEGIYTTGIIKAPLFFYPIQEQALVFNVKDKGLVIVTGCGHQTVPKLLQRINGVFGLPIYGILGGLHFPIYGDTERFRGYPVTGYLPWQPLTEADVIKNATLIKKQNSKLIGVSTHDSSPNAIEAFKKVFSIDYKDLRTGEWIVVK